MAGNEVSDLLRAHMSEFALSEFSLDIIITSGRHITHTEVQETHSQCHSIDTIPVLQIFGSPKRSHNCFKLTR